MKIEIEIRSDATSQTLELINKVAKETIEGYLEKSEPTLIAPTKIGDLFLVIMIQDRLCKVLEAKDEERWKEVYRKAQSQSNDPRMN